MKKYKLIDIAYIWSGYQFRRKIENDPQGGVYVVQMRDIDDEGNIDIKGLISTNLGNSRSAKFLKNGDLVFIAKGKKNIASMINGVSENTVCAQYFFHLRIKESWHINVLPEFICWQLNQVTIQNYFRENSEGSLQVSIRKPVFENTKIYIPSISDQRKIVDFNLSVNSEIRTYRDLIENRQKMLSSISSKFLKHLEDYSNGFS